MHFLPKKSYFIKLPKKIIFLENKIEKNARIVEIQKKCEKHIILNCSFSLEDFSFFNRIWFYSFVFRIDEEYTINVFVKTECKPIEKTDVNESTDKSDKLKCNNAHKLSKKSHQIKHRCKDNKKPAFTAILKESQTSGEKHVPKLVIRKKPIICHDNEQTTRTDKSSKYNQFFIIFSHF